jgi:hypothetical protein
MLKVELIELGNKLWKEVKGYSCSSSKAFLFMCSIVVVFSVLWLEVRASRLLGWCFTA